MEYYIVKFTFLDNALYTVWYSSDIDGFLTESDGGKILVFETKEKLMEYASNCKFRLCDEDDEIICWEDYYLKKDVLNCNDILDLWNITEDLVKSVRKEFNIDGDMDIINSIYNKLFCGCNISAVKKCETIYIPEWSEEETNYLRKIVKGSIKVISEILK